MCYVCRITQKVSDTLRAKLKNCWKYILHCISSIVSNIRNLKVLCDAYTVQKLYTSLLKCNGIICLLIGIVFGNFILTVFNKVENHLWLHLVYFLNHLAIYEENVVIFLHTGSPGIWMLHYPLHVGKCSWSMRGAWFFFLVYNDTGSSYLLQCISMQYSE